MAGPPRFLNNISLGQVAVVVALIGTTATGALYIGSSIWQVGQTVQIIRDQLEADSEARARLAGRIREQFTATREQEHIDVHSLNERLDTLTRLVGHPQQRMPVTQ